MNIPDELIVAGIARAMADWLRDAETAERVARHIAAGQLSELMTPAEAAELLRTTPDTLMKKYVAWKLDVSTALGVTHLEGGKMRIESPRFYRSQIMARMHEGDRKGSADAEKVTNFPSPKRQQQKAS